MTRFTLFLLAAILPSLAATQNAATANAPLVSLKDTPTWTYPQRRELDGYSLIIHAPQIRTWPDFTRMTAQAAVELTPPGGATPKIGTVSVTGTTEADLDARIVQVLSPTISEVRFADPLPSADDQALHGLIGTRPKLDVPLDLFLAYLADDVLSDPPPPGFSTDPPAIVVASAPTLLLFVNGEPVTAPLADTGLEVVVNANWPTFRDPQDGAYYLLLDRGRWLTSPALERGWRVAETLPAGFERLPTDGEHAAIRQAVPPRPSSEPVPAVHYANGPTELIVSDGAPTLETIPDTGGLQYVSNTSSPLFMLDNTWYFLVSGRWFTTARPDAGPWQYRPELPDAFALIPEDHPMASVRASVPGTVEAKMAALEALLPTKVTVAKDAKPTVEVTYAGKPKFEPIPETTVARAVNTGYDVIQVGNQYYLCYAGVWYVGSSPTGPWTVATSVPAAIYDIPPSSPAYHVTQVTVVDATSEEVVSSYPSSYTESVYVVYGTPYYGTGWYYYPYIYGGYYYPYWGSYGHGSWYNPATGRYVSRSVGFYPDFTDTSERADNGRGDVSCKPDESSRESLSSKRSGWRIRLA